MAWIAERGVSIADGWGALVLSSHISLLPETLVRHPQLEGKQSQDSTVPHQSSKNIDF